MALAVAFRFVRERLHSNEFVSSVRNLAATQTRVCESCVFYDIKSRTNYNLQHHGYHRSAAVFGKILEENEYRRIFRRHRRDRHLLLAAQGCVFLRRETDDGTDDERVSKQALFCVTFPVARPFIFRNID